jgi:AraC-like DNA-binding protein
VNLVFDIRALYKPLQPVLLPAEYVTYQEVPPACEVDRFVYCYWRLKTNEPLSEAFSYRVVADGCMDVFFELDHPADNFVMGLCNGYTEFGIGNTFDYMGIRFYPGAFPLLFGTDASEVTDRFESLRDVVPALSVYIETHFLPENTTAQICRMLDHYFSKLVADTVLKEDHRFYAAIEKIITSHGTCHIETALNTGLSARQLRRLFDRYIGDSPKTFSKIIRFQNALGPTLSKGTYPNDHALPDEGYYDQAHLIKEFKHFSGLTPNRIKGQ